jgi:hypothetical protein
MFIYLFSIVIVAFKVKEVQFWSVLFKASFLSLSLFLFFAIIHDIGCHFEWWEAAKINFTFGTKESLNE